MTYVVKFISKLTRTSIKLSNKYVPSDVKIWRDSRLDWQRFETKQWKREIHVSGPRPALPPVLVLLLRPVAKIGAMVFGRFIRKWWQRLTPQQREIIKGKIRARQTQLAAGGAVLLGGTYIYYLEHIFEEPITKRKRFIIYNDEQMKLIAELEYQNQTSTFSAEIIPKNHPIHNRVAKVAMRLIHSNWDMVQVRNKSWAVTVIDKPEVTNAFVLPNGSIFMFTGMLNLCTNDDQLAVVMAHEMSHAILSHVAENLSKVLFVETLLLVPLILFWALLPDAAALFSQWLSSQLADLMIHLPFNRYIEKEADTVGLKLAAKACYDVREGPVFWGKMKVVSESDHSDPVPIEWLSTHPSHEKRQLELSEMVPIALKIREASSCPVLPPLNNTQKFYGKYGAKLNS